MTFFDLILRNLWKKKARSIGLAFAVAIAVMAVVTLDVTSSGLEQSAAAIISVGKADFTVVQKGASDTLSSTIDQNELARIGHTPGVASAVGVLVETQHINADNPVFIEIGINPGDLAPFGVKVVGGQPYSATASHEVMLGWRAAANLGLHVGDRFNGQRHMEYGGGHLLDRQRLRGRGRHVPTSGHPGLQPGSRASSPWPSSRSIREPRPPPSPTRIDYAQPELTTIRTASQFGRADQTLVYLQAAVNGSTVLAILIGAVIVGNTMLLSLFERTREFGLLRAIGWTRRRTVSLLLGESLLLAVLGAAIGVALSFAVAAGLAHLPALKGILHPNFTEGAFWRALFTALVMTLIGALYPTIRAALLSPLKALSYE